MSSGSACRTGFGLSRTGIAGATLVVYVRTGWTPRAAAAIIEAIRARGARAGEAGLLPVGSVWPRPSGRCSGGSDTRSAPARGLGGSRYGHGAGATAAGVSSCRRRSRTARPRPADRTAGYRPAGPAVGSAARRAGASSSHVHPVAVASVSPGRGSRASSGSRARRRRRRRPRRARRPLQRRRASHRDSSRHGTGTGSLANGGHRRDMRHRPGIKVCVPPGLVSLKV